MRITELARVLRGVFTEEDDLQPLEAVVRSIVRHRKSLGIENDVCSLFDFREDVAEALSIDPALLLKIFYAPPVRSLLTSHGYPAGGTIGMRSLLRNQDSIQQNRAASPEVRIPDENSNEASIENRDSEEITDDVQAECNQDVKLDTTMAKEAGRIKVALMAMAIAVGSNLFLGVLILAMMLPSIPRPEIPHFEIPHFEIPGSPGFFTEQLHGRACSFFAVHGGRVADAIGTILKC